MIISLSLSTSDCWADCWTIDVQTYYCWRRRSGLEFFFVVYL